MITLDKTQKYAAVGHEKADVDSLIATYFASRYFRFLGYDCIPCISSEPTQSSVKMLLEIGLDTRSWALPEADRELILVDCHNTSLDNRIIACFDHHPTDFSPFYKYCENVSSSSASKIVFDHMLKSGFPLERLDYYLVLVSIYIDTQSLKSSKFVQSDMDFINETIQKFGFDKDKLFELGLFLNDLTQDIDKLKYNGFKEYRFGRYKVASTYLQAREYPKEFTEKILLATEEEKEKQGYDLWVLLLHNPIEEYTLEFDIWQETYFKKFDRLASRGVDVMPEIERRLS